MAIQTVARRWRIALPLAAFASAALPRKLQAATDTPTQRPDTPRVDRSRLPAPGTYTLPVIQPCPDGLVLTHEARGIRLRQALGQRLTVLSLMYTYCRDPIGCPLAWRVMTALHARLAEDSALTTRAQLISLSFDPTNDTPSQMALFGRDHLRDPRVRWQFLTTASVPQLLPIIEGLGQEVTVETDERGRPTRTLNHMLKLFLIDGRRRVREIYSVGTADAQVIHNDLLTLMAEDPPA
jgi:protein SCO1